MAIAHVAGAVALLMSANAELIPETVYAYLTHTADRDGLNATEPTTWFWPNGTVRGQGGIHCGNVPDTVWPNNRFGHCRVNVAASFDLDTGALMDLP
ncbi:Aste57867_1590 [Aphanomyces stellatus]|uniref:subtilisin n=1 Tax=Aphanomyces stellatus TaxID=120398 RepID=A0A485K5M6_9STRA|nr:hypothetical protein As57867_001589 [Aphanomyces stellatus]VFT78803.1 Aste57867_1590 [Aphanomyces stellatus]